MVYAVIYLNEFAFPAEASVHDSIPDCEDVIGKLMEMRGQKETGRSFDPHGFFSQILTGDSSANSYMIMATGHKLT